MTPPGLDQPAETVTVVEHNAFASLYQEELSQEGLPLEVVDVERVPRTTVTIYPDAEHKDLRDLDLLLPALTHGYRIDPDVSQLSFDEVEGEFKRFQPLPVGYPQEREIKYEGRHLITDEVVEEMKIKLPLLADGMGAISFYREELERAVKIRGKHAELAPLIQRFLEDLLFGERVTLYDPRVIARLADTDVREHLRATFVPLLLRHMTHRQRRLPEGAPQSVTNWAPYQATHSERHPAEVAEHTPFNLVPCNRQLEVAMAHFLDRAADVAAFAKNQGPQCLRVDSLNVEGRRTLYTPDFLVRLTNGHYLLAETKGRADPDVAGKARAAVEWCKAASAKEARWEYLYVRQDIFERLTAETVDDLVRACRPALTTLLKDAERQQLALPLDGASADEQAAEVNKFIEMSALERLPGRYRKGIEHAVLLLLYGEQRDCRVSCRVPASPGSHR